MTASHLAALAEAVRTQARSSVDLVTQALTRIDAARNINAVVSLRRDAALDEAGALDAAIAGGFTAGPLAGLPVLVKDVEDVAGLPTTFGSLLYKDALPATQDGLIARRLRQAGAIMVGKTNTSELAAEGYTANPLYGITRNPWALDWSPGGSSGGSGAAMAAGLAPIATGTDIGGSVRTPAAFCGLVGLKPTNGLIGRDSILPSMELNNHGLFGWTVADVRLLLSVLAGPVAGDPSCLPPLHPTHDRLPVKVHAVAHLFPDNPVDEEVVHLFEEAIETLQVRGGIGVQRAHQSDVFPLGYQPDDFGRILGPELIFAIGSENVTKSSALFDPSVRNILQHAQHVSFDDYLWGRKRRLSYVRQMDDFLGDNGIILTPTHSVIGWLAEGRLPGADEPGIPSWAYNTEVPNLTGHPAISVPAGRHSNGVPFGLQIIGPRFDDQLVLNFATLWEALRPWPFVADGFQVFD